MSEAAFFYEREASATLDNARRLTEETARVLAEWGLPEDRVAAWEVAVGELTTNVCRHGYADREPGILGVRLNWDTEGLSISVIDEGTSFDPGQVPNPPDPDPAKPDSWPEGGMGIMLARSSGDDLRYRVEGGRNTLTVFTAIPRG